MNVSEDASKVHLSSSQLPPAEDTELTKEKVKQESKKNIKELKDAEVAKSRDVNTETNSSRIISPWNAAKESLTPYVPADHRPSSSNTSSVGALVNLLKASMGLGVLAMPLAFKNAGLMVGVVGTVLVALICTHSMYILTKTSQELCVKLKKPALGYADTCRLAFEYGPKAVRKFAPFAKEITDWALALTHTGACCVYVVVIAESFKQVSEEYGGPLWSVGVYCSLTLVLLVPLTQIDKLKYLVPFSALANVVWVTAIAVSMYYCLRDHHTIYERKLATSIERIPNFISTCLFAMEGIGVVMPIENDMKKPHQFLGCPGVLTVAMSTITVLYGTVGFAGYLKYGEGVRGSLTFNLPQHEVLAITAKILVACVMILTFSLIFYVPFDVVWRRLEHRLPPNYHCLAKSIIRFTGTLFIVGIAAAIPRMELFIGLVGAICLSSMGLIFPAVAETVWRWGKDLGPCYWIVFKNIVIVFFAMVAMVTGVMYSIITMYETL